MNNISLPTITCPNCGASSSTYVNCEFCGSSLAGVNQEMIKIRQKQIAEEQQRRRAEEERQQIVAAKKAEEENEAARRKRKRIIGFAVIGALLLLLLILFIREWRVERALTRERGVVINGVRWATRNVAAPGTFATSPESGGRFFQWNRSRGWFMQGNVTNWDSSTPIGNTWTRDNDPCPQGWRVPTQEELLSLYNAGSTWTTRNGVNGRLFGTAPNQIFLPAVGQRSNDTGSTGNVGTDGFYWSSTQANATYARRMRFTNSNVYASVQYGSLRARGFSIRCVAE